jgi:hypothetical protein
MVRYKMLGLDVDSASIDRGFFSPPTQYRTWVVDGQPDLTGQFYTGEKSGPNPLVNISAYAIFDPTEVVNFNLPNPLDWSNTFSVLPSAIADSQIAIVDGYAYLFGGLNSNIIYSASLNRPTVWTDTGARLPVTLAGSQLAIIGDTIYLFGGQTGASLTTATDVILSAPLDNPLNWTNTGAKLAKKLAHSQLCVIGSNIYLFGGNGRLSVSNSIFTAPISNPLAWTDTGSKLVDPLYGSNLAVMNNNVYLFGGCITQEEATGNIYSAPLANPTTWSLVGALPYPISFGQFCTIGPEGYLFTTAVSNETETLILQCETSDPTAWIDTLDTIPGVVSQSQLAIIYDRIWLFGGNGSSIIFSNNSILKYNLNSPVVVSYGNITRTQYDATANPTDLFEVIGFAYWKTDYGS